MSRLNDLLSYNQYLLGIWFLEGRKCVHLYIDVIINVDPKIYLQGFYIQGFDGPDWTLREKRKNLYPKNNTSLLLTVNKRNNIYGINFQEKLYQSILWNKKLKCDAFGILKL